MINTEIGNEGVPYICKILNLCSAFLRNFYIVSDNSFLSSFSRARPHNHNSPEGKHNPSSPNPTNHWVYQNPKACCSVTIEVCKNNIKVVFESRAERYLGFVIYISLSLVLVNGLLRNYNT